MTGFIWLRKEIRNEPSGSINCGGFPGLVADHSAVPLCVCGRCCQVATRQLAALHRSCSQHLRTAFNQPEPTVREGECWWGELC
jgi:hypothetical protein